MNNDTNLPFYLAAINGKDGFYDAYIVNTTNKEYFLRTRYEEKILKAKSALFYGQVINDRDHESISPWICDDKSETYLLYFSNLPYYCQNKTYDEYLKRDDVFKLTCKIENIFHQLKTVKIRDKNKDLQLDKLDSFVNDEIHKIEPNIKALVESLNSYLKIYQSYHSFGKLKLLFSYFETLCTINDFSQISKLQAGELEIGEKWKTTPEYVEYSKLDPNSLIAKKLKEDTITRLTNESLKIYLDSFDVKFKSLMEKRVEELPIGLKGLLCNINIKIKEKLTANYDSMSISKINNHMFNFVDSMYKDKGTAEKNISELPKIAPELANSHEINYLVELGRKYDDAAKASKRADEAGQRADKWKELGEKLKNL